MPYPYKNFFDYWLPDRNVSFNKTTWIEAHNTYSTVQNGIIPLAANQKLSITDLLNKTPARVMSLDVYYDQPANSYYMSHSKWDVNNLHFKDIAAAFGIKVKSLRDELVEIKQWLDKNPKEVLMIHMEEQIGLMDESMVQSYIKEFSSVFGKKAFTNGDLKNYYKNNKKSYDNFGVDNLPSIEELSKMGKQIVITSQYFGKQDFLSDSYSRFGADEYFMDFYKFPAVGEDRTGAGAIGRGLGKIEDMFNTIFGSNLNNIPKDIQKEFTVFDLMKIKEFDHPTIVALDFLEENDKRLEDTFTHHKLIHILDYLHDF